MNHEALDRSRCHPPNASSNAELGPWGPYMKKHRSTRVALWPADVLLFFCDAVNEDLGSVII